MSEVKVGQKIKVTSNVSGHNYKIGSIYIVSGENPGAPGHIQAKSLKKGRVGYWLQPGEYELISLNKADLEAEKIKLLEQVADLEEKLAYLSEHNLDELDVEQYRMFKALDVLDNTTDRLEKAKLLAKLLKNDD